MNPNKTNYTSITPVLWTRKDKSGCYPIKIRITENRKSFYINVGWSVPETVWSKSKRRVKTKHKDHIEINYEIEKIVKQYESQLERKGSLKKSKIMVFNYLQEVIMRKNNSNMFSTRNRYNTLLQHLRGFWGNDNLYFYDIDEGFLYDFMSYLGKHIKPQKNKNQPSKNSVINYMKVLRTLINIGIKEGVYMGENPFNKISIPKKERSDIKTLSKDEIWLLDNLHPDSNGVNEMMWNSINVFLFCFWSNGLRISDCLLTTYGDMEIVKHNDHTSGYFVIRMKKTNKTIRFPLTEKNIVRLLPYIEGVPPLYNWKKNKYYSTNLELDRMDNEFIGVGLNYGKLTPEQELLGGWTHYQQSRIILNNMMKSHLDSYNRKKLNKDRVEYYFDEKWDMNSREYHVEFRKSQDSNIQSEIEMFDDSKRLFIRLCFSYFINYCRNPLNKNKFIFPYLRGFEKDDSYELWEKISSSTSLINKYLKKLSTIYGVMNFSTHSSRHTFSSISKDLGVDIYDLKEWLGHSSVKVTEGYINSLETSRLKNHNNRINDFLNE